jgi:hypothetical protein
MPRSRTPSIVSGQRPMSPSRTAVPSYSAWKEDVEVGAAPSIHIRSWESGRQARPSTPVALACVLELDPGITESRT